jgi:hypothetical protein
VIQFDPAVFATAQTITLSSTLELSETAGPEVIEGPGANLVTVSGNNAVGVFQVDRAVIATLKGLTISGGAAGNSDRGGGGIYIDEGTLMVTDCTIDDNTGAGETSAAGGGGIDDASGSASITGCIIANNNERLGGGGIMVARGAVTITRSTIENNTAQDGGGIETVDRGELTLIDATILNNNASDDGGGIGNGGGDTESGTVTVADSTIAKNSASNGGGLADFNGTMTVTGSTISDNTALVLNSQRAGGGGILCTEEGTLAIVNSTIAGNSALYVGGGIAWRGPLSDRLTIINCTIALNSVSPVTTVSGGGGASQGPPGFGGGLYLDDGGVNTNTTATLDNTIIALNTAGTGSESGSLPDDIASAVAPVALSASNNLIGTGDNGVLTNSVDGNLVGVAGPGLDPGGLASNGGPTQTIALEPGSPAIDAGNNALAVDAGASPLTADQRGSGFARIVNGTVDIGAFEVQPAARSNPAPIVTSISPDQIASGNKTAVTLTVDGSGFVSQSVVDWNATPLATTFVSPTELTATIPASDFASAGNGTITVTNPAPGGGVSTGKAFQVQSPPPSAPDLITGILPVFHRKTGRKGKPMGRPVLTGFTLKFRSPLNPAAAVSPTSYKIDTVTIRKVKKTIERILHSITNFTVSYTPGSALVALEFGGTETFPKGGQITVLPGVTGASGGALEGTTTFAVAKGGKNVEPE